MTLLSFVCIAIDYGVIYHNYNIEDHMLNQPVGEQLKITADPMGIQPRKNK